MYMAVSETAKSHGKSGAASHAGRKAALLAAAALIASGMFGMAEAADKDIVDKGAQPIAYDISPANDGTNIAIGKNAKVFIGGGTQESMLSFGEKVHKGFFSMHIHDNNHAKQNLPEAIAVGTNSYARTGAIEIGAHTLAANQIAIGDTTADQLRQFGVASTTLGTNSYTGGGFATTIGSYNVQTNQYEAKDSWDTLDNATKNAFSTVIGTFNSNESMTGSSSSGVANMISGMANKVTNSNGAIVMGAGNSVKESSSYIDASPYSTHFDSVADMQKALMDGVASSAGGATLVIGGANSAEKTQNSQIMGVGNSMKSTTYRKVQYNYLDGFNSSITDASHVKVLGQGVTIKKGADSNTVIGDYRTVAEDQTHNVIIGNADEKTPITTKKKDTVILGHNANATVDGGVALGAGSVASVDEKAVGYDPSGTDHSGDTTGTWKSKAAAVSVGDASKHMTRQISGAQSVAIGQGAKVSLSRSVALGDGSIASTAPTDVSSITIPNLNRTYTVSGNWPVGIVSVGTPTAQRTITNVAAGRITYDSTDAVNGSELYVVAEEAAKHATVKAAENGHITVKEGVNQGQGIEYTIGLNTDGLAKSTDGLTFAGDDGQSDNSKVISRKLNEQLNIVGGATDTVEANNIGVVKKDDNTLNIRLAKNITGLTSLQATTVISGTVTVDGNSNVITGLSNTTWDKTKDYSKSTKAATEAQLHEAMTQAAADANDTHIQAGDYAVDTIMDKDGKTAQGVSIGVVDKTGTVGTVRITDVAKASDVGDVTKLDADIQNADGKTTVVDAVNKVNGKVGDLNYSSTKYVTKGEDVTTSIGKLDEAIKSASEAAGKHTIVSTKDSNLSVENIAKEGETANYQISLNKDLNVDSVTAADKIKTKDLEVTDSAAIGKVTINKDDKGTIGGLTNKTWDAKNITSGQAATEDQLQAATKNAVNYDGDDSKTVTLRKDTTIQNVANTTIEEGSKNAVNAGTVYKETRVEKDGIFIRQANTAGQNITALDHQVAANTESIYNINNRVSNLDNRVNKVGAGAAALAALHPLDFNPDDKWDFAVGYGNYRNANSVALGAFYRPNENTMLSLGTNFGNGENMFNAGVSFKIGKGNSYAGYSKVEMAKVIDTQSREVAALKEENAKNAKDNAVMKAEIEALKKQVEALAAKK